MDTQKAVFTNKELGLRLAGLLRLPDGFDLSKDYPAVVVTGPMLSIKEQAQSVYAKRHTELGYVTLVFDGSYFGESQGTPATRSCPTSKNPMSRARLTIWQACPTSTGSASEAWASAGRARTCRLPA